ncbi:MAG: methyltransferase domain-containing protein [Treponemataceae bacterium]
MIDTEKYINNKIYERSIEVFDRDNKKFYWPDMDLLNITLENKYLILKPKYSINPLFNYEPYTHKLKNYYRIYKNIFSKEDIKEAFKNPVIYQLAGGAKPSSKVCNLMTVLLFFKYAKNTAFNKEALKFIIKKLQKGKNMNLKKILKKIIKNLPIIKQLLGRYNNLISRLDSLAGINRLDYKYDLILKNENKNLKEIFIKNESNTIDINNEKINFLTGVNAMYGVTENSLNFLIEYLKKNPKNNKLLSVGCGLLNQVKILESANFDVYGVDIDFQNDTQNLKFHNLNDYNDLPFEKDKFDFVLCQEVIEHIENPWLLFRKIKKVLKTNGILVLTTPNILSKNSKDYFMNSPVGFSVPFNEESLWQHINPMPFWEIMHISQYNNFDLLSLSNNMEYYFDYKLNSEMEIKKRDLTLQSGDVLHFVFLNKDNEIKPYIPKSTYEVCMDLKK